ncbi:MAG: hypothetical protein LUC91_03815, partial [Prevotella sp.]|nr:hypothetical protein [Prevotella sp.]
MPNRNFFTNEIPSKAINASNNYGIISGTINPADISDGLTERGPGLGKLGSSMPTPLARLFLFSAALREVNTLQAQNAQTGHVGTRNVNGELEPTPYHDLVGELLDMLEFIFKFGNEPEFHVQQWNMDTECRALEASRHVAHKNLASALRSAFEFGVLQNIPIYLFKWNDDVIGGSSPVSLVYTSANLGTVLQEGHLRFTGDAGNRLFAYEATPLHKRSASFQEYLFRLLHTDLPAVGVNIPLAQLSQYIQDSATNYDILGLYNAVLQNPSNYTNVRLLQTRGANVNVAGVQLRVFEHIISVDNSGYILQPTVNYYQHGGANVKTPMILTENGIVGLNYADNRAWNPQSDHIDSALPTDINLRTLPGFGSRMRYPFLTANDFLEEKVIEVSYEINRKKFFTGCAKDITFLLPLKKAFFEYFSPADLYRADGTYTDMLKVEYDENHNKLKIELNLPLVNGNRISLVKTYDTSDTSGEKLNCYDGNNTFDFAVFPFYRLEPDSGHNVYNVMVGRTLQQVDMSFYEPSSAGGTAKVPSRKERRTNEAASLSTDHIRVRGAFSYIELIVPDGQCGSVGALAIPIFTKVDSDRTHAEKDFFFGIDFGTTNTHVTYVGVNPGNGFTLNDIEAFDYNDSDSQMVVFNNEQGTREFGTFTTALNREMVPAEIGQNSVKFPMRTATYQVSGIPLKLEMFFNTNIGFNYGEDISKSKYYKTNIKWDRFDEFANQRMSSFFAQMLWMMKNKSVLNRGSDTFKLVVTYPISMRPGDYRNFLDAWEKAKNEVQCNVEISFRTESVAPYYSYLASLNYGTPYANMDIGGGTTDILYVKPESNETLVCSAFFAANDLWNDGVNAETLKENGFIQYYKAGHVQ